MSMPIAPSYLTELDAVVAAASIDEASEFPTESNEDSDSPREFAADDNPSLEDVDEDWISEELPNGEARDEAYGVPGVDPLPPNAGVSFEMKLAGEASARDITSINARGPGTQFKWENYIINPTQLKETGQKEDDERELLEFTEALPQKSPHLPEFVSDEVSEYLDKLREERLVLISCPDEDVAFSAAHALIDGLNLPQVEQRRLLNLDKSAGEGSSPSIYYLRKKSDSDKETVVLVDAATEKARPFLEPIIYAARLSSAAIQDDLRRNEMYMLCLVDPAYVEDGPQADDGLRQARELKFPCWRIPFLRRLLERHRIERPEEVEQKIKNQRAKGWWSKSESEFYFKLKSYLQRGALDEEIKRLDQAPPPGPVSELFKGDRPLSDTVLYVATFFPNLTPYEFNQIVALLLSNSPEAANNGVAEQSKNSADEPAGVPREKAPLQLWREWPDKVLEECSLVTIPLRGTTKGVNFSNHNLRDKLREYLEREYSFFLENRFQDIQELGLIFSPFARVSQSAAQLSVEMATSYPEYYGSRWLSGLVTDFESSLAGAQGAEGLKWRFIEEVNTAKARKRFYQSLSELVRAMLEEPRLAEVVEEFLQQLLLSKQYGGVLEVVRRLQFAPAFDQFKWLKQLFNRGDQQTREQTGDYLRGYLRRMEGRVYQVLSSLESWLPKEDRPLQTYPFPAKYALRLLLFYFSETNSKFDARYFGSWPSAHPLFAFRDADTMASNLRLLVRLLFHPGMKGVFREQRITQANGVYHINTLVTGWFFILQGKGQGRASSLDNEVDAAKSQLNAAAVSDLLLEQIVCTTTTPQQQAALSAHWREESQRMLRALSHKPYGSPAWEELAWKRDLIVELITRYEQLRVSASSF